MDRRRATVHGLPPPRWLVRLLPGRAWRGTQSTVEAEQTEARLRDFAELGSDWLWEMDADLRFTFVSANFVRTGRACAELLGRRRDELRLDEPGSDDWDAHLLALGDRLP